MQIYSEDIPGVHENVINYNGMKKSILIVR
jgi:hypothetical protein